MGVTLVLKRPITIDDYISKHLPKYKREWTMENEANAKVLLSRVNDLLCCINVPSVSVNSGWRPKAHNKAIGGSPNSLHISGCAIDLGDSAKLISRKICFDLSLLIDVDLYMEDPEKTSTWVHLQTKPPKSGNRIFLP